MNKKIQNIKSIDKNNFFKDLKEFPQQIEYILKSRNIFKNFLKNKSYTNILICGMGGSAISGDLIKSLFQDSIYIPIYVNRDYFIPNWVTKNTLIILSSYSGNTEEILSCYKKCIETSVKPIIIASNGKLLKNAKENNFPFVEVPSGLMPRAALGYSISILIKLLNKLNIISDDSISNLENAKKYLYEDSLRYSNIDLEKNSSILLALKCYNKFNIIYTSSRMEVIGLRFRAQLAENSKILSSHFTIPEQNHNEIEAFKNIIIDNINIVWINDSSITDKTKKRMEITSEILSEFSENCFVEFDGPSFLIRELRIIYFLDWVSFYCSIIRNTNPYPVEKIKKLKSLL